MEITKRFNRILAIYFQLQSKPLVKAQELADKFEVSLRTIYRDIKSLEEAGVPIYGEAGYGYSLMSTYKISPMLFSEEEALSFAVAEKLMQHYLDRDVSTHFDNALLKMKAILRYSDKENLAHIENKVLINKTQDFLNKSVPSALAILFESIAKKRQIRLSYKSIERTAAVERIIEPIGIFQESRFWYFMAYCYLREEVRQFRLDRIQNIELTDSSFTQVLLPLQVYLEKRGTGLKVRTIKIRASKQMARYMEWDRQHYGFFEEIEVINGVEMIFASKNGDEELARWLMMYADEIEILEPESLRTRMQQILHDALRNLSKRGVQDNLS